MHVRSFTCVGIGCVVIAVLLAGCDGGGTSSAPPPRQPKPSAKPPVAQTRLEQLEKENASLNQRVQNLGAQIKQVRGENEALKRENQSLRRTISQNKWRIRSLVLLIALLLGLPLAVLGGMFFARPRTAAGGQAMTECPKCHWKLEPGTVRCPNPECQTRLH